MPQTYKGTQIPAYGDTADAPAAFTDMVDGGGTVGMCTSGTRPANPVYGHTIFNTSVGYHEFWNGSAWTKLDTPIAAHPKMYGINWVASGLGIPAITDTRQFLIQTGRHTGVANGGSYLTVTFPNAFPNGTLGVYAQGLHTATGGPCFCSVSTAGLGGAPTRFGFVVQIWRVTGEGYSYSIQNLIDTQASLDYIAIGW